ncbi:outer membrane protein assembly factor BamB family protein [Streptomyces jumonjinensis]|nr:PQQ-binding-like beta-propeller repeat protein [Streptomyces jumonjinensis]
MTQPPLPPNQPPPGGGFGMPLDPPPGFGAPQEPPAGFGAPQPPPPGGFGAPAGGPGQGPGYGYPRQQPPYLPYGHPTQPVPQPVPQPGTGGPRGGGKPGRTRTRIVIAAAVAVALIIGGGILFASAGDGGGGRENESSSAAGEGGGAGEAAGRTAPDGPGKEKVPADTASRLAFQHPEPAIDDITNVRGSWTTGKAFVKPGVDSVVGYDPDDGDTLWKLKLPGQVCASSRHQSSDDKVAIVFEAAKRVAPRYFQPCTEVGVVDLGSGKLLWRTSVKSALGGDGKVTFAEVTQSGSTVAAGGLKGGAAFDLNSGEVRWKPTVRSDDCYDSGYAGGPALVAVRRCGAVGSPRVSVQAIDPKSGAPRFSYRLPDTVEYASVVSTEPLVVAADVGDTAGVAGFSDLFSLDGEGKLRARIPATGDTYQAKCRMTEVESCRKIAVGNGRVYLPTAERESSSGFKDTNEIVSFDLATGKPTRDRADAGPRHTLLPLRMDGGDLIAYKTPAYDTGGQVISIDGGTFRQTVLMRNPDAEAAREAERGFSMDGDEIRYDRGRLYLSASLISKETYVDRRLVVAFSTAD